MFCYQCQETAGCKGCTVSGVCGKRPEVAALQDLLVYATKGLSSVTTALRKEGKDVAIDVNHMVTLNLFTTITNANFDEVSIRTRVTETLRKRQNCVHSCRMYPGFLKRPSGLHRKRTMQQRLPKSASFPNPMKISVLLRKPSPMASKVLLLIFIMQMS